MYRNVTFGDKDGWLLICLLGQDLQQMLDAVKTIQPVDVPSQELKALKLKVLVSALLFSPAVSKASRPSFTGRRVLGCSILTQRRRRCGMPGVQASAPRQPG